MLKCSQNHLIKPLVKVFNAILSSGHYPKAWSVGRIVSIHKKGDPTDPSNFRGITVSSALSKVFNSILNERLYDFLESRNLMCI